MTKPRIDYPALFPHVIEGYIQGKSQMAIATELNTHPSHVSRALHVHGLSHWKAAKLVRDGLTAQQIIEYATAKEPRLPLVEPESPDKDEQGALLLMGREIVGLRDKLAVASVVIQQQATTIEMMQACFRTIGIALESVQLEIAERQKAGAV